MSSTAPGFYDDSHGIRRWWDGHAWTGHIEPASIDPAQAQMQQGVLNAEVAKFVAAGYSVEMNDGTRAVVARRVPMSLLLNLLGVFLTGGLWLIYVLVRLGSPRYARHVLTVDADGVVNGRFRS
ncbi:MAG: DUF2510 domain-containing protein [Actinomycetota bacterium]|nr:DUF2510 domain-containing protein [Actinomycetota bacterium]